MAKPKPKPSRQAKRTTDIKRARSRDPRIKTGATRRLRNTPLPGLEDHGIKELDDVGLEYAEIRDERMDLTRREHTLQGETTKLMKKHGKTIYRHNGVEITLEHGEDHCKVKIRKGDEEDDDAAPRLEQTAERRRAVEGDDDPDPESSVEFADAPGDIGE